MKSHGDQDVEDLNIVAKEFNCSRVLLQRLQVITDLGNSFDTSLKLVWNKSSRFCGRNYYSGEVWIGLYFDIKGNYTFLLGFYTEQNHTSLEKKFKDNHQQYFYKWYDIDNQTKENWLYIELGKELLFGCYNTGNQISPSIELQDKINQLYRKRRQKKK